MGKRVDGNIFGCNLIHFLCSHEQNHDTRIHVIKRFFNTFFHDKTKMSLFKNCIN